MAALRCVFLGYLWPLARSIIRSSNTVLLGCGIEPQRIKSQEMMEYCVREGIRWFDARSIRSNVEFDRIVSEGIDLIVVGAFGQILDKRMLDLPRYGVLNFHPSFLPAYKGGSPIEEQILAGDHCGGATLHWMTEQVDEGPIAMREEVYIGNDDDYVTVLNNAVSKAEIMMGRLLSQLPSEWPRQEQASLGQTVFLPRKPEDGLIDWGADVATIYRKVLALGWREWVRFVMVDGELIVRSARIIRRDIMDSPGKILIGSAFFDCRMSEWCSRISGLFFPKSFCRGRGPYTLSRVRLIWDAT